MPVYIIRAGNDGPVKIGCAKNINLRINTLQTSHYEKLELIRSLPGNAATERWLHKLFANLRMIGEWFAFSPDMMVVEPPAEPPAETIPVDRSVPLAIRRDIEKSRTISNDAEDEMAIPTPRDLEILALDAGISMTEACNRAKVSPAVFHRWKRGESNPGAEHLRAIIRELRVAILDNDT
jgi:T5orf172 domain